MRAPSLNHDRFMRYVHMGRRRMNPGRAIAALMLAASLLAATAAVSGAGAATLDAPWSSDDFVQGRLVSTVTAVTPDAGTVQAGIELRLSEGWHSYWRMPGDGGLPPVFDFKTSANLQKVEISWPLPGRFEDAGLYSFGYKDSVILPATVTLARPGQAVTVRAKAEIMVCSNICVPQELDMSMTVPAAPESAATADAARIAASLGKVPVPYPASAERVPDLAIENLVVGPKAVVANVLSKKGYGRAEFLVEAGDIYITAKPEITLDELDPRRARIVVAAPPDIGNLAATVGEKPVTVTFSNAHRAIERTFFYPRDKDLKE